MLRTWVFEATSERIVEDIDRFLIALEKIIEAKGAYVTELNKRTGRRSCATRVFTLLPRLRGSDRVQLGRVRYLVWCVVGSGAHITAQGRSRLGHGRQL